MFNVSFRCAVPWFGLGRKGGVACWPRMLGRLLENRLLTKQTFTPCHTGAAQWGRDIKKKENPGRGKAGEPTTGGHESRVTLSKTRGRGGRERVGNEASRTSDAGASAPLSINFCRIIDAIMRLRVDAEIFENGKKSLRFQIYPDTCGRGLCLLSADKHSASCALRLPRLSRLR